MVGIQNFDPKPHLAPKPVDDKLKFAGWGLTGLGLACVVVGLFVLGDVAAVKAKIAFLTGMNYIVGISFGAIAFLSAMSITEARWSRPLKRIAEGFVAFTPVATVLFALFVTVLGGLDLYEWHNHPEQFHGHKQIWLTDGLFIGRNLVAMGLLSVVGVLYVRRSLKPDLLLARQGGVEGPGWWNGVIGDATDVQAESASSIGSQNWIAPVMGILYALAMSLYAFDAAMSLAPHWYANMFGGWFFASCFWAAMVWIALYSLLTRNSLGIEKLVTPAVYHDLGKLIFAFSMVWAYMFFAQLLPIWYGNMTEEIGFLLVRMTLPEWSGLSKVVGAMCFLIPFSTLLSRGIKKMPIGFGIILTIIAVGILLERFLVVAPSVWMEPSLPLGPVEVGIWLFFIGAFLSVVNHFISGVPPVPVTDPYMLPHPDDVHVHSRDDHHHAHGH